MASGFFNRFKSTVRFNGKAGWAPRLGAFISNKEDNIPEKDLARVKRLISGNGISRFAGILFLIKLKYAVEISLAEILGFPFVSLLM